MPVENLPGSFTYELGSKSVVFEDLRVDESGLLEVSSDQAPSKGWVRTADRARIDADGFLFFKGRADDMLIVKGVNVYPAAIQDALAGFRPRVTGYFRISLDAPGPLVTPPLVLRVEHGAQEHDDSLASLSEEIIAHCRKSLRIAPEIELTRI